MLGLIEKFFSIRVFGIAEVLFILKELKYATHTSFIVAYVFDVFRNVFKTASGM